MADRKRTPDILSEVLGDAPTPAAAAAVSAPPSVSALPAVLAPPAMPAPPSTLRTARPAVVNAPTPAQPPVGAAWTFRIVSFQNHNGWRPRYVNGEELADWTAQPEIHEYANQLGQEGWELAGASGGQKFYGVADNYQLYFKRPA